MSQDQERIDGRLRWIRTLGLQGGTGPSLEDIRRRLDETPIAVVVGAEHVASLDTQMTALTAVNLLARLFRRLVIVVPSDAVTDTRLPFVEGTLGPALAVFAKRVHASVRTELAETVPLGGFALHVADTSAGSGYSSAYCSGAGWGARVGRQPVRVSTAAGENPIGPLIAAALGCAELFKLVFNDVLQGVIPAENETFSALTLEVGDVDPALPLGGVTLPHTTLVGAGSIGSAFLWGLTHLRGAQGELVIVDHDTLKPHNPDRAILILDEAGNLELPKATWARDVVRPYLPGMSLEAHEGTIRGYVDGLPPEYVLPLAISAVDSIESRRDVQDALPERILNASTGPTKVEISRHGFADGRGCLYCMYLSEVLERALVRLAMARTGFESERDVAELLMPDNPRVLTAANLRGIERHNNLRPRSLERYAGRRLPELLADEVWYGQAPVQLDDGQALITTAFVSALAGFLLLAEVLKESDPDLAAYRLDGVYEQELLGVPNGFRYHLPQDRSGYCLCGSPLRQSLYGAKYLVGVEKLVYHPRSGASAQQL